ncbi:unnamed protein product [Prorocentrum cordatum]|uniref:Integrase catalytic domain-containing protein n=1 Tax=Prorocentrum cordatum TaxID=2364126 RepID=A0ABN9S1M8_9DINO|nr:unnamed protein product [Polarella glacialis]
MASDYNNAVDPKVPVLKGETLQDFTRYKRAVQAAELSCESAEQKRALGPKLYRNLLGADNSISVLIEQSDPVDYATEDGARVLLKFLEDQRFAKSSFRELPKAFDQFFDQTHFERKGEEPMAAFCTAMEVAKRNLEEVDPDTKISANELGYHTLKRSGLDRDERNLVIARAEETFDFQKISMTLKNLFPRGGGKHRERQARAGWRWANYADGDPTADEDDTVDEYWVQDDDGYWYEWDEERGIYAALEDDDDEWDNSDLFYIEDGADAYLANEDDDYHQALVTLRESRFKMNKIRAARGFFKGKIDGVVDESAAAGGKAAGKGSKGGGKGKDKGKSKDKKCGNCGRMDHATQDCTTPRASGRPASKGFKGRGKTSKAGRPRRLGFWAMTTLVCVMPDLFSNGGVESQEVAMVKVEESTEHDIMMTDTESDYHLPDVPEVDVMISSEIVSASLLDSGATVAVAGRGWLDKQKTELAKKKWIMPIGIGKVHVIQEYFEIPGDMIGLTSKKNLADWKTNLYLREDGQWADFEELGLYDMELMKLPGGHAGIDILDFDLESHEADPLFEQFRIRTESVQHSEPEVFLVAETLQSGPDFKHQDDADRWVQEAIKNGNKGIFKKNTLKRIDRLMKEYAVIFDVLRDNNETFLWGLFAKEARFTRVASKGGHANATPSDLTTGVNFNDPKVRSDFLFLIRIFKPWMVSVAFPCTAHSNMQEFQRAQGMGDRVDDLIQEFEPLISFSAEVLQIQAEGGRIGIGENPLTSRAWREAPIANLLSWHGDKPPLYETVTLHQCMYGLTDSYGDPIRKPTRMMVPNGSCFSDWLERKCDGSHKHADMVGRSAELAQASAWPDDLGKTLVAAGTHELARRSSPKEMRIGSNTTKSPSKQVVNAVAKAFRLRKELIDVRVLTGTEEITPPRGAIRRIYAMYSDEGVLADYSDAYAGDQDFATVKTAKRFPTDTVIAIYVNEPKVQTSYPATVHIYGSKPKAFTPDDREADEAHRDLQREGEGFGDKPSDITTAQWGALKKLHLNLSHPSAHALQRRLKSYGVSQKVLDAVDKLDCVVCKELGRPTTTRSSNLKLSTEFNQNVFLDEAEVILSDGTRLMVMVILDDASGFRVIIPTKAVRSITGEESLRCFSQGWLSWAGAPKVLYYDAAKGHITKRFVEVGDKYNILMRPVPAEAPQLKGRVERAIDFFKDHFQRLNRDVQLTKDDDPHVWTAVIASTCNDHIRRNGFTPNQYVLGKSPGVPASLIEAMEGDQRQLAAQSAALFEDGPRRAEQIRAAANRAFFELDSDDAVRRAMVGRVRPPRGPFVPGQLVYYWREVKHVKSKRLQGEHGWRGPAIVLATEGHTRLHLSYRGVPVLVTPEQVRHASRNEAEMVENEDLVRQLSHWRGGPTLQKGFIDERGPGPDGSDKTGVRRERDEKDSDHEDDAGDPPVAKAPRAEPAPPPPKPVIEATPKKQPKDADRERMRLRREALKNSSMRLPKIKDDPTDQDALLIKVKNRTRDAFLARRTDTQKKQVTPKKGRELRSIPPEWKAAFDASDLEEWRKWVEYDAVEWPTDEELAGVDQSAILPMRRVRTDKNEATRGNLSYEQHPLKAKSRNIVPGYKDKQLLAGELKTNAPTLTDVATAVIVQEAASQEGWRLEQGDVDSAFLNGKYLDDSRRVYFRAPKGGLPAVPELGWPAVPEGTVLKAKKGIYGLNDAPLLWYEEHRDTILSLPGASKSKLCPALFIFHDEHGKLIGLIGTHVDDDLVAGSPEFFANQVAKLRKIHCCGKWQTAKAGFHHCGRFLKQNDDGTITCSQKEYTESIEKIPISSERRKDKEAKATAEERAMLHSGNGQIQWLVRSTRMDLAFRLVESQARAHDSDLKVQDLLDFNKLVSDAKTDHVDITFQKINIDDAIVVAVGDSSHGNVGKTKTASQAGLVILLADNKDDKFLQGRPAKVTPMLWRSHRIKRVVRSTLSAETMAALEAVESGDMLRQHLVELHYGLGYRTHMEDVKAIKMVEVTDCKSLYDLLQKRGTVPSERRLLIDIEALRNDLEFNNVVSKWVNTKQMLADCLTKNDVRAGDYMRYVLQTGEYRLTEDLMADQIIAKQRMELKGRRGEYYRAKYPKRLRPAEQHYVHEGYTYFEECIADVRYNARVLQPAPKPYLRWRMTLGQREDDVYYEKLEEMVDWSGLDQVSKRRRIPTQIRKLLTIYAPTKAALERYEKDFTEKHVIKKPKVTDEGDMQDKLDVTEDLGAIVESAETVKVDGTNEVAEIYMMDAAGAETEEVKSGAAAAATVVVCAVCRMVVDQCECGPRTRKKANQRSSCSTHPGELPPVPGDDDEGGDDAGDWEKLPHRLYQERQKSTTPTKKAMMKARALHEKTKHASYMQIEEDFGEVLEEGVLEAYEVVVNNCAVCRKDKKIYDTVQRGINNKEFWMDGSGSSHKGKSQGKTDPSSDHCEHPKEKLTTRGSNQYKDKLRCMQCGSLLVDTDTDWWRQEKEYRAQEKLLRAEKEKQVQAEMRAIRLRDMYQKASGHELDISDVSYHVENYHTAILASTGILAVCDDAFLALRAASPSESFDEPRRPGETDDGEGEDVDLSRLGTLRFAFDVIHQGMNCESSTALELTRELQQWVEENEGVDYKGMKTRHWARRLTRGLGRHRALRQWLWTKGVAHTLEELTRRSEQHTQRYEAISHHHAALRGEVVDLDGNDLQEVTPEEYAQAVAFMVSEWWVCKTRWWIMKMIDEFYLLSPEMLIRGHPRWAFRNGGTPEGWKRYKVPGKGEMWWNPKTKRMQRGAPEQESPERSRTSSRRSGSRPWRCSTSAAAPTPLWSTSSWSSRWRWTHPALREKEQADFLQLPVVDAEPGAEGERFTLNEDGSLRSITAGSFDVAVLSLVLSYVPTPLQRLEMIRKARRCLTDERGLLFVVEAGRVVPSREFYEGDPATEWSNAISKCGFKCIRYADWTRSSSTRRGTTFTSGSSRPPRWIPTWSPSRSSWARRVRCEDARLQGALEEAEQPAAHDLGPPGSSGRELARLCSEGASGGAGRQGPRGARCHPAKPSWRLEQGASSGCAAARASRRPGGWCQASLRGLSHKVRWAVGSSAPREGADGSPAPRGLPCTVRACRW